MRLPTLTALLLLSAPAWAVPTPIPHQGRMLTSTGAPVEGPHALKVRLWDAPSSGVLVFEEEFSANFSDGYYAVNLGSTPSNPLSDAALGTAELWIGISIDAGPEMGRIRLNSVPYARLSGTATNLSGGAVDATEIRINGTVVVDGNGVFQGDFASGGLGGLACGAAQIPVSDGSVWSCADLPVDTRVDEAQVDAWVENNGYAVGAELATVATTGSFTDLSNLPVGLEDGDNDTTYTAGAGLTLTGTTFAANQTTIGQWAVTAVTNTNNWLARVDGTATRLTAASGLTVTGGASVSGGVTLATGGITVGNSTITPRKLAFGRDDGNVISFTGVDGVRDTVNVTGATSGQLIVGAAGKIAYRHATLTEDSYLYFNLTGSSIHCTLLHNEDDTARPGYYFGTDGGNGYDAVWGNGTTPTFILRREGANLTAAASAQAPIIQNASFFVMCF